MEERANISLALHLGAHRTATTAIQVWLKDESAGLKSRGLRYWGPDFVRSRVDPVVARADRNLSKSAKALVELVATRTELDVALHEMDAEGADRLVVSDENLLGTMRRNFIDRSLYLSARPRMQRLAEVLPLSPDVVYLSVRDYAEYWASTYAYAALRNPLPAFDDISADLMEQPRGWNDVVSDISAAFPDAAIRIWAYERDEGGPWVLLEQLAGDAGHRLGLQRRNSGLTAAQFAAAQKLKSETPQLGGAKLAKAAKAAAPDSQAPFMPFSTDQVALLSERYRADLKALGESRIASFIGQIPGAGT